MEIALPLLAISGLFVISNAKNKTNTAANSQQSGKEGFQTAGRQQQYLPNLDPPIQNFPITNNRQLTETVNNYSNQNIATDKYLDQNAYERNERAGIDVGKNPQHLYSLQGDYTKSSEYKHNNMIAFNGGKVKGKLYHPDTAETTLDNMTGSGSQIFRKMEQAPLFKPEENMQLPYGMSNQSDFYLSRVNPSMRANNVKPFDSIRVGPGLNQGYGTAGSGGFNSGMEARDAWLPRTVDEMRVDTNPKLEYSLIGHEGPADAFNKNIPTAQLLGVVEKQRPDTFFINSQDRWLTTTGAIKGDAIRPEQELGIIRRNDGGIDYSGPAGAIEVKASYAPQNFEPSHRQELTTGSITGPSVAAGRGPLETGVHKESYANMENHRTSVRQPDTIRSGFSGAVGAVIAPIMDMLRPTRKEETSTNVRIFGEGAAAPVPKQYVFNQYGNAAPTTIRETTLHSTAFNINNQKEGQYVNSYTAPGLTQRDTTSSEYFTAAGGQSTTYGNTLYGAAYNQHNNDIKSSAVVQNYAAVGGTQMFNPYVNMSCSKTDCGPMDGRMNPAYSKISGVPPSVATYGAVHGPTQTYKNIGCERIDPAILDAFNKNPYTHSLMSAV